MRGQRREDTGPDAAAWLAARGAGGAGRRRALTRRAFLGWAGAAGATAAAAAAGCTLPGMTKPEAARANLKLPAVRDGAVLRRSSVTVPDSSAAVPLGIAGLSPYYVPNKDFYLIDTAMGNWPMIDPATWRLQVDGLVERPFSLSFDELLALSVTTEAITLSCVSNSVGGSLVGNAQWQGVPLRTLLDRAGVRPGADQVLTTSAQVVAGTNEPFTAGFPTAAALDGRSALVAVGMNGEPLPFEHGFPARMVVSGLYGFVSATKWLSKITLTTMAGTNGYWVKHGWAKQAPVKTQSRIDVPTGEPLYPDADGRYAFTPEAGRPADVAPGARKIAGVAWAPSIGIAGVEVQVDDGPWQRATLAPPVSDDSWVQWHLDWSATPGPHVLRCRATDKGGATQSERIVYPQPNGAEGWHTVGVTVGT